MSGNGKDFADGLLLRVAEVLERHAEEVGGGIRALVEGATEEPGRGVTILGELADRLVRLVVSLLLGSEDGVSPDQAEEFSEAGMRLAAAGVDFGAVTAALHAVLDETGEWATEALGQGPNLPGPPDIATAASRVAHVLLVADRGATEALRSGFDRHRDDTVAAREARAQVLRRVLHGAEPEGDTDLDLTAPVAVVGLRQRVTVEPGDFWHGVTDALKDLSPPVHGPVADEAEGVAIAALAAPGCQDPGALREELRAGCAANNLVAVFEVAPDRAAVARAYELVCEVMEAAPVVARRRGPAMTVAQVLPFYMVAGASPAALFHYVCTHVGVLLDDAKAAPTLLDTARVVVPAGKWKLRELMKRLGVKSPTTAREWVANLGERLGIDFWHGYVEIPVDVRIALHLYDLFADVLPPPGDPAWRHPLG